MTHFTQHHTALRSPEGFSFPQTLLNLKLLLFFPFFFLIKLLRGKEDQGYTYKLLTKGSSLDGKTLMGFENKFRSFNKVDKTKLIKKKVSPFCPFPLPCQKHGR